MPWPKTIPPYLCYRFLSALSLPYPRPQDLWGEVRDWLILHGVEAPERLPKEMRPPDRDAGGVSE